MVVIRMSDAQPISLYPETPLQREQIIEQANKQDENISEYCLEATRQRIIRERQGIQGTGMDLAAQIEALADDVTAEIAAVTDAETPGELVYLVALWELVSSEYPNEECAQAMEQAPDILAQHVAALREHGGDDT
jgi:hypothetical protein